jgi:hypothetical protein
MGGSSNAGGIGKGGGLAAKMLDVIHLTYRAPAALAADSSSQPGERGEDR